MTMLEEYERTIEPLLKQLDEDLEPREIHYLKKDIETLLNRYENDEGATTKQLTAMLTLAGDLLNITAKRIGYTYPVQDEFYDKADRLRRPSRIKPLSPSEMKKGKGLF